MRSWKPLLMAACLAACAARADAQAFTRFINFGDSLSDVGNTERITFGFSPGSDYHDGRYSNGPVWAEDVAARLRLPAVRASSDGGLDYAVGGSRTGSGSVDVSPFPFITIGLPNAGTQIDSFLRSNTLGNDDLVTLWSGANDLLDGQTDATIPANNMRQHVERLVAAGAKNILVFNLPPLGDTPRYSNTSQRATMTARASQFNTTLSAGLNSIQAANPGVNLFRADIFSVFADALVNKSAYGFTNVEDAALRSDGTVAPGVDGYLFYDTIHPTRVGHDVIGNVAFERVTRRSLATPGNSAWGNTNAWAQHRVPDFASAVTLSAASKSEVTLSAPATVRKLTVASNTTLRLVQTTLTVTESPLTIGIGGTLAGRGTVAGGVVTTTGTINPGDLVATTGQLTINGTLTQEADAKLVADFGANEADRVIVTGTAHLGGTLTARFAAGYIGLPGTQRNVMTFARSDGAFASVLNGTSFPGLSFNAVYLPAAVAVRVSATAGDANLDASIDFVDLVLLAQHYGDSSGENWLSGDFDGSGGVDFADLVALAQNYEVGSGPREATATFAGDWALAQSLVPEPTTLAAMMLLPIVLGRQSRRR